MTCKTKSYSNIVIWRPLDEKKKCNKMSDGNFVNSENVYLDCEFDFFLFTKLNKINGRHHRDIIQL